MSSIQLAGGPVGGLVQGNFGNYTQASDGTFTVDTRDAPSMLALGMNYISKPVRTYVLPAAPLVATSGQIVASAALSNGGLTIANQPDVIRPLNVVIGTGTAPITAGTLSMTYAANDGTLAQVDVFSLALLASAGNTIVTTKGVQKLATAIVGGLAGGTSPFIHIDTTAAVSVPVDVGAVDFSVFSEYLSGVLEAPGTIVTASLGGITPTTAPNGTRTYSFGYSYFAPIA